MKGKLFQIQRELVEYSDRHRPRGTSKVRSGDASHSSPVADHAQPVTPSVANAPSEYVESFGHELPDEHVVADTPDLIEEAPFAQSISMDHTSSDLDHVQDATVRTVESERDDADTSDHDWEAATSGAFAWDELESEPVDDDRSHALKDPAQTSGEQEAVMLSHTDEASTIDLSDEPDAAAITPEAGSQAVDAAPSSSAFAWDDIERDPSTQAEDPSADTFKEDLLAIASGQKQYDEAAGKAVAPQPHAPEPTSPSTGAKSHALFDKIAKAQSFVNTFDLGTIEVEKRMDDLDRELDEVNANKRPIPILKQS